MITRLLVANRGEIACRIIKTAKKMGIITIAIYSEADTNALHVKMADEAFFIGPSFAALSYLNIKKLLEIIKISGADSVHPGYGFLSENPLFAEVLEKNNITFVGPSSDAIRKMGDKIKAKKIAKDAGVEIVPGYSKSVRSVAEAIKIANKLCYPVIVKAAAGGGGKGMRIVRNDDDMAQAMVSARSEAKSNFSDERVFIEKYIEKPRHIEIQILGDKMGNYLCFGERECSIQRHHQKVIEEAPSSFIDSKIRRKMYAKSIALAKEVGYFSAGTIEYIMDQKRNFYFMEMNTRLQVEHPVTEMTTGVDLIEQMIRVARGEELKIKQRDIVFNGYATECRVCAEDPESGFVPSTGVVLTYREPESRSWLRVDSGIYEGGEISMFYDSMVSKVITHGETREKSISRMRNALNEYMIQGVYTNTGFLQMILNHQRYIDGDISTHFVDEVFKQDCIGATLDSEIKTVILSSSLYIFLSEQKRALEISGQERGYNRILGTRWVVLIGNDKYPVTARAKDDGYKINFEDRKLYISSKWIPGSALFQCTLNGQEYMLQVSKHKKGYGLSFMGFNAIVHVLTPRAAELSKYMKSDISDEQDNRVNANMAGLVTGINFNVGDRVKKGQTIMRLEAMKMENFITSPMDGYIQEVYVSVGNVVLAGTPLALIAQSKESRDNVKEVEVDNRKIEGNDSVSI